MEKEGAIDERKIAEGSPRRQLTEGEMAPLTSEEKNAIGAIVEEASTILQSMKEKSQEISLSEKEQDEALCSQLLECHKCAVNLGSQLGSFCWDSKRDRALWSAEMYDVLGIAKSEDSQYLPGKEDGIYVGLGSLDFQEKIFKSDRLRVLQTMMETLQMGLPFDSTFMIQSGIGENRNARWVHLKAQWAIPAGFLVGTLNVISDDLMHSLRSRLLTRELQAIERFHRNNTKIFQTYIAEAQGIIMLAFANMRYGIAAAIDVEPETSVWEVPSELSTPARALQSMKYLELIKQAAGLKVECRLVDAHKVVLSKMTDKIKEHDIPIRFNCPNCKVTLSVLCYQRVLLLALTCIIETIARPGNPVTIRVAAAQFNETGRALIIDIRYLSKNVSTSMSNVDLEESGVLKIVGSFLGIVGGAIRFANSAFTIEFPVDQFSFENSSLNGSKRQLDLPDPEETEGVAIVKKMKKEPEDPVSDAAVPREHEDDEGQPVDLASAIFTKSTGWKARDESGRATEVEFDVLGILRSPEKPIHQPVPHKAISKISPITNQSAAKNPNSAGKALLSKVSATGDVASNIRLAWRTSLDVGHDSIAEKYYEFRKALLPENETDLINMFIPEEITEKDGQLNITDKYGHSLHLVDHFGKPIQNIEIEVFLIKDKKKSRRSRDTDSNSAAQTLKTHVYEFSHHITHEELIRQKNDLANVLVPMKFVIDTKMEKSFDNLTVLTSEIDDPLRVRLVAVGCGWSIVPAISEPFVLKTRTMRADRKKDFPLLCDCPKVLRKVGYAVYRHFQDRENIHSVEDILNRMSETHENDDKSFRKRVLSELRTFSKDDFNDMIRIARGATRTGMKKWFGEICLSSGKFSVGLFFDKKCLPILMGYIQNTDAKKGSWYWIPDQVSSSEFPKSLFISALGLAYQKYFEISNPRLNPWLPMTLDEFLSYKEMAMENHPFKIPPHSLSVPS